MKRLDLTNGDVAPLFTVYRMTPGRRIVVLNAMFAAIPTGSLPALAALIQDALAGDALEAEQQKRWDATRSTVGTTPEVTEMTALDSANDVDISAIYGSLDSARTLWGLSDPLGAGAEALLKALFRDGVAEHVRLAYADQVGPNGAMVTISRDAVHQPTVEALRLRAVFDRISARNDALIQALSRAAPTMKWTDVLATQAAGHERFLRVIAGVLAYVPGDTAEGRALRAALLQPVADQHNDLRELYRRRVMPTAVGDDGGPVAETTSPA